jgi:hypothetical protein
MIPCSSDMFVSCESSSFVGGSWGGGGRYACPLVTRNAPIFFFGQFFLFLADFAILSGLLKIIPILGIRVLVYT